jgi:hypothetical protein
MQAKTTLVSIGVLVSYVLLGSALANADTIFNVAGYSDSVDRFSGRFTGTLTLNTENGNITAVNITVSILSAFQDFRESLPSGNNWQFVAFDSDMQQLDLTFSTSPNAGSLVGFAGGTIVSGLVEDIPSGTPAFTNFSGSITPALSGPSPVPEPSSLALLALSFLAWMPFTLARKGVLNK